MDVADVAVWQVTGDKEGQEGTASAQGTRKGSGWVQEAWVSPKAAVAGTEMEGE